MILPSIDGNGNAVILSPQYQSPSGYSKTQGLDTKSCPRSNALKGGVLLSPVYGITAAGVPPPWAAMPEFGHSQVPLFYRGLNYGQIFGFNYDANPAHWGAYATSAFTANGVPAIDAWTNYLGQYPGDYPNRTPGPEFWMIPGDPTFTPYTYPTWTLAAISVPHTGVGNNSAWTLDLGAADTWQVSLALSWFTGYTGLGAQVVWGTSGAMSSPNVWPDIMKPSGLTLPFKWGSSGTDWTGSTVSVTRISKPGYPNH